jgi:predicted ATPase
MSAAYSLRAAGDTEAPTAYRRGRPFVGRAREIDALASCLQTAAAGHGQLVAVVGEAGIGKTCIVEELLARAGLPIERTSWGRCPEDEGVPAYWPWTQALRGYVERAEGSVLRAARVRSTPIRPVRDSACSTA